MMKLSTSRVADRLVICVNGEIDMASAPTLREALDAGLAAGERTTVDIGGVTFIDSSGLHAIVTSALAQNGTGPLRIANPSPFVMRTMEIVGLVDLPEIDIRTDVET